MPVAVYALPLTVTPVTVPTLLVLLLKVFQSAELIYPSAEVVAFVIPIPTDPLEPPPVIGEETVTSVISPTGTPATALST